MMKFNVCAGFGVAGSVVSYLLGGFDAALQTLLIFIVVDYVSGLAVAGIFKKSGKTETGGLNSTICFQGLIKKCMILLCVLMAHRLDVVLALHYIRNGVCFAFMANEAISILENAGEMGVPIPQIIRNAIDLLKKKGDS